MDYDNNNTGILWRNKTRKSVRSPSHRGACTLNETEYWISAWPVKPKQLRCVLQLQDAAQRDAQQEEPTFTLRPNTPDDPQTGYSGTFESYTITSEQHTFKSDTKTHDAGDKFLKLFFSKPDDDGSQITELDYDDIPF